MPKSCIHTGGAPSGAMRYGRSSSTFRPMRSSIGRLSESVTGPPQWKSLKRSVPGRGFERAIQAHAERIGRR